MNTRNVLGFFAKYPEPGKVKTRLAKEIGTESAACFYRRVAEYVLKRTAPADSGYLRIVFYTPDMMMQRFEDWLQDEMLRVQRGADVGERMENALEEMFRMGAEKAVVVGADIPGLHKGIIDRAFQYLDSADLVIGPAMDGGYYLIGMKSTHPEIFRDITWGTGEVFRKTVLNIEKMGLRYRTVETLFDVDGLEDFLKAEEILKDTEE
jgi:rSAM/selenodomain-associated transferase 1